MSFAEKFGRTPSMQKTAASFLTTHVDPALIAETLEGTAKPREFNGDMAGLYRAVAAKAEEQLKTPTNDMPTLHYDADDIRMLKDGLDTIITLQRNKHLPITERTAEAITSSASILEHIISDFEAIYTQRNEIADMTEKEYAGKLHKTSTEHDEHDGVADIGKARSNKNITDVKANPNISKSTVYETRGESTNAKLSWVGASQLLKALQPVAQLAYEKQVETPPLP